MKDAQLLGALERALQATAAALQAFSNVNEPTAYRLANAAADRLVEAARLCAERSNADAERCGGRLP